MKVVMIVGEPAVGKSSLMRELMSDYACDWELRLPKFVPHHYSPGRAAMVLGRYDSDGHKYPGTDRMSMAAQPHVLSYIRSAKDSGYCSRVIFEGDRLGNRSMILALRQMPCDLEVVRIRLDSELLASRRATLRADQNPKFWASRLTKLENMADIIDTHWTLAGEDSTPLREYLISRLA